MAMSNSFELSVVIFVCFNAILTTSADQILPVLMWSSTKQLDSLMPSSVGQSFSTGNFMKHYVDNLLTTSPSPLNIVAFEISELSLEDLSQFGDSYSDGGDGGVFSNLKSSLDGAGSASLVQVSDVSGTFPGNVIADISAHNSGHVLNINQSTSTYKPLTGLDNTGSNLIIVHLPKIDRNGDKSIKQSLSSADQLIGSVMSNIGALPVPYLCFLLPVSSPKMNILGPFSPILRPRRQLMASTTNVTFYEESCGLLMYATNFSWVLDSPVSATVDITSEDFDTSSTTCNTTDAMLAASFTGTVSGLSNFTMKMVFTNSSEEWTMKEVYITYSYTSGDYDTTDNTNGLAADIDVPAGMSYHCTDTLFNKGTSETVTYYAHLEFTDFQLELGVSQMAFSDADDCIGYFNEAIWMGLLVTFMLLIILSYGMYMLVSITTMDRFDDAKGPAIAITTE